MTILFCFVISRDSTTFHHGGGWQKFLNYLIYSALCYAYSLYYVDTNS